jgi:hypothetical protein
LSRFWMLDISGSLQCFIPLDNPRVERPAN